MYSKTYNFIYLRAKSIFQKEEDAVQLMKEVYKAALEQEIKEDRLYAWLGKRVYTLGCSKFRKKKAREVDAIEMDEQAYLTSEGVDLDQTVAVICDAMEELPDMYQATLYAFYYDHMTIKEIASVMGYHVGVILNRLNYSHKYFEKALEFYAEEHGVNVKFSVEAVVKAMVHWSKEHALSENVAGNIYGSICRELGVQTDELDFEGEAGLSHRVREMEEDELGELIGELEAYQKKPRKEINPLTFVWIGVAVLAIATLALIIVFTKQIQDKQPEKTPEPSKQEAQQEEVETEEQEEETVEKDDSYVIPDSDTRVLTREDLQGLSKEQLYYARNEIFARHGMIFGVEKLDNYFAEKSWYEAKVPYDDYYDMVEMSMTEEKNLQLILKIEEEMQ